MLTPSNVQSAIAADDLPALRAAFDSLVAYPDQGTLDGFADVAAVDAAFDQVCGVLLYDQTPMAENTFALLWRLGLEAGVPLIGQTYASGANLYVRTPAFFAERFAGKHSTA